MDALIVSIQMILVGRIIHPTKPYMYSLSHLTRNKKWKLWVGWHGSSCWLLYLCVCCVLCFVLSPKQSGVLECHLSHISKNENYELCILAGFLVLFITTGKKKFKMSVWRVVLLCQFLVLAGNRQFFCCGGKVLLPPEKKVHVLCLAGCAVMSVFGSGGK